MTTNKVPESWQHVCDSCGITSTHTKQNRPIQWAALRLDRNAVDMHGVECASANINRLLCHDCANEVTKAINEVAERRRLALHADG